MDPSSVNWFAVILAPIAAFAVGSVWYSPVLFGKQWMKEVNLKESDAKKMARQAMLYAFLLTVVGAVNLAFFLGPNADATFGAMAGFLVGAGWISTAIGVNYLFEQRSMRLFWINAGYNIVIFTLMGAIIGAM